MMADAASVAASVAMSSGDSHDLGIGELAPWLHVTTSRAMPSGTQRSPCQKKKLAVTALMRSIAAVCRAGIEGNSDWFALQTCMR